MRSEPIIRHHVLYPDAVGAKARRYPSPQHQVLAKQRGLRRQQSLHDAMRQVEFFISVPHVPNTTKFLNEDGWFRYQYKYGARPLTGPRDYHVVPMDPSLLDAATQERLRVRVPNVWKAYHSFQLRNSPVPAAP